METLYQTTVVIKRLRDYFQPYLCLLTKPSGHKAFLLILALLTMQFATSINNLYKWFLARAGKTSLNAYYYLLNETAIPMDKFFAITVRLAMSLLPSELNGLPVFLIIDDTLQEKFGTKFACYQTMFDHAKHNGTNYLKGHCFVALTICIPVIIEQEIKYLNVPVGYRLRGKDENKLKMASEMIDLVMDVLAEYPMVVLLCDSWYPKGKIIETVKKHTNLELISNVRVDTAMFEPKPERTGKPGRPRERGKKLNIHMDFSFIKVGDYFIGVKTVLTNLFEHLPIYATVTTPDLLKHDTYRVFICTVTPHALQQQFKGCEKNLSSSLNAHVLWLLPLFLYSYRWAIEVMFYEQKKFWSFGLYRLRSKAGIENFVNFASLSYACMKILPLMDDRFSSLASESPQSCKYIIGDAVRNEIFLLHFGSNPETALYSHLIFNSPVESTPCSLPHPA